MMLVFSLPRLQRYFTGALLALASLLPLSAHAAAVRYNDWVSYHGANHLATSISINFTYNTDSSTISNVSGLYDDGTLSYKIYNETFLQGDPTPNFLNVLFANTDINFSRRNYFNTFFFVDNNVLDPLRLAYQSTYYNETTAVVFCTVAKCTPFTPLDEKLTNLDLASAVPVPNALVLFAASWLSLHLMAKRKQFG